MPTSFLAKGFNPLEMLLAWGLLGKNKSTNSCGVAKANNIILMCGVKAWLQPNKKLIETFWISMYQTISFFPLHCNILLALVLISFTFHWSPFHLKQSWLSRLSSNHFVHYILLSAMAFSLLLFCSLSCTFTLPRFRTCT